MSIKDIFFGDKNIKLLTKYLGDELDIEDTKSARNACRSLVVNQMKLVYEKNKDKIIRANPQKILPKLNEKSVDEALKAYSLHMRNTDDGRGNGRGNGRDNGRDNGRGDRNGNNNNRRKQKTNGPRPTYSGGDSSGYAPITSGEGDFINAFGEIDNGFWKKNQASMMSQFGSKNSNKEDIDRQVMMRKAAYDNGEEFDDENGGMGGMGGMDGMGGMNPYMGYGMMPLGNKKFRPPEMNFCVDGGDTRGIANGAINDSEGAFNPMMMNPGMNPGMMNTGMMNPSMMNTGMMNPGMMNSDMNPMMMSGMNPMMNGMNGMNPMMMNNGMGNMGGFDQMSGGNNNRRRNNADIEQRLAQMEAERGGNYDSSYSPMMNANPMMMNGMNPMMNNMNNMNNMGYNQMSGQYNQNFHMGGRGGSSEIEEQIKDKKHELANKLGLDPEVLMSLRPDQIESLLKGDDSDESNNDDSDNDSDSNSSDDKNLSMKELLLKKLMSKKKNNEKYHKKLGKDVKNTLNDMDKKRSQQKKKKHSSSDTDSSYSHTDSDSDRSIDTSRKKYKSTPKSSSKHVSKSKHKTTHKTHTKQNIKNKRIVSSDSTNSSNSTNSESEMESKSNDSSTSSAESSNIKLNSSNSKSKSKSQSQSKQEHQFKRIHNQTNKIKQNEESKQDKQYKKYKNNLQERREYNSHNESDDDTDVKVKKRNTSDKKISVTHNNNVKNNSPKNHIKRKITIRSDEWTEPQFYNNYRIDLDKPLYNIQQIKISGSSDFPLLKPEVDDAHNTFCIIYKNEEIPIELEARDDYTLTDIIHETNDGLDDENIPIRLKVDKKGYISVENTKGEKFELDLSEKSIGPYLGFQEQSYKGHNKYTSECPHMFLEQSYFMFIKEISPDKAICEITPTGEVIQLIKDIDTNNNVKIRSASSRVIKCFTIQYRYENDIKSNLIEFYEEPHEITFDFQCDINDNDSSESRSNSKSKSDRR